jgi:hypothetical protein
MSRLTQTTDDQTVRFRDLERRVAELEAKPQSGVIARQTPITTDSSTFTGPTGTTDFVIPDVAVDVAVLYVAHLQALTFLSASGEWSLDLYVDGIQTKQLGHLHATNGAQAFEEHWAKTWTPPSGVYDLGIRLVEQNGTADLTFVATAIRTREFWIEAAGPR